MKSQYVTHHELAQYYRDYYAAAFENGTYEPATSTLMIVTGACVLLYLTFPPRSPVLRSVAKYAVLAPAVFHAVYALKYQRSQNVAAAFGVGVTPIFIAFWVFSLVIAHDPFSEFKRIVWASPAAEKSDGHANGNGHQDSSNGTALQSEKASQRRKPGGHSTDQKIAAVRQHRYTWQSYPTGAPVLTRLLWSSDLFLTLRGPNWNWYIPVSTIPPKSVTADIDYPMPKYHTVHNTRTRSQLMWATLRTFLINYLILDILKVVMMRDPYFWGLMPPHDPAPFPSWLPQTYHDHPVTPYFLRGYRTLLVMLGIKAAVSDLLCLFPFVLAGLLGPSLLGAYGESWQYLDAFGDFSAVLDRGIAGWWREWWHQSWRFTFDSVSKAALRVLGLDHKQSFLGLLVRLWTAFAVSGLFHAAGSYTAVGPHTRPFSGSFAFFVVQPVGLLLEGLAVKEIRRRGWANGVPRWAKRLLRLVYVHVWFYITGPLLADDLARQGIWLFEPVPVSFMKMMGLGIGDENWLCWGLSELKWWSGDKWWKSGLYI